MIISEHETLIKEHRELFFVLTDYKESFSMGNLESREK